MNYLKKPLTASPFRNICWICSNTRWKTAESVSYTHLVDFVHPSSGCRIIVKDNDVHQIGRSGRFGLKDEDIPNDDIVIRIFLFDVFAEMTDNFPCLLYTSQYLHRLDHRFSAVFLNAPYKSLVLIPMELSNINDPFCKQSENFLLRRIDKNPCLLYTSRCV